MIAQRARAHRRRRLPVANRSRPGRSRIVAAGFALALHAAALADPGVAHATFSIVAYDSVTQEIGRASCRERV